MVNAPARVFQVSELVYLISEFIDKKSLARLVITSKTFFFSMIPHIWESVSGAAPLFQLLPCTISSDRFRVASGAEYSGYFTFTEPLSEAGLNRFNVYAPHVKHLDLFRRSKYLKLTSGWDILIDYVQARHILLPNLETLVLRPPSGTYHKILPYPWVLTFCSPKLQSLSIDDRLGPISPVIASALCHLLINTCPNLLALKFELSFTQSKSEQDKYIRCQAKEIDYIPALLQPYSTLQQLSVGLDFVMKYAPLISQLQNLKYLETQEAVLDLTMPTKLPPNSFPSLTALKFNRVHVLVVESVWEKIPDIFTELTALECIFFPSPPEDEGDPAVLGFPPRFATFLNSIETRITNLTLHFDPEDYFEDSYAITIDQQTLRMLARLPLRELSVESAKISLPGAWPGSTSLECEFLASTFPELEVLRWTAQEAKYKDLYAFVGMPNLRHLALCLVDTRMTADMLADHPENTSHPDSPFRFLETDLKNNAYVSFRSERELSDWSRIAR
ncbi:hypothetical protein FRC08_009232 [Ceratobasidium sp. 394]|nr:hypothetical protein FRC08_009232 [Ceratobasidium sp. 394]